MAVLCLLLHLIHRFWFDLVYFQQACGVHTVLPDLNMLVWSIQWWGESWRANSFALLTFPTNWAASPLVRGAGPLHWWPLSNAKDWSEVQTWWLSGTLPVSDMTNLTFTQCGRGHVQGWTVAWKVKKNMYILRKSVIRKLYKKTKKNPQVADRVN